METTTERQSKYRYITEGRLRTQQERAAKLEANRQRLMREVQVDGSASQEWLIASAASSALEN